MKVLLLLIFTTLTLLTEAQILCIKCYNQNARVLIDSNNLILNGGFENGCPANGVTITDTSFCPNSQWYHCDITNWTCNGGGINTYAHAVNAAFSVVMEGTKAVYFGNKFSYACSISPDTSCMHKDGCKVTGIPSGYPVSQLSGYGGDTGVSLSQTVTSLIVGQTYELEFWAGGEAGIGRDGLFAVDVGFGNIFLRDPATPKTTGVGRRYVIVFTAQSSFHSIKFTNWGHIYYGGNNYTTELILDDVRLFAAKEGDNFCSTGLDNNFETLPIKVFPNPFTEKLNINCNNNNHSEIVLYDITGRKLLQEQFVNAITLFTEKLINGLYNYEVKNNGISIRGKLTKQ